MKSILDPKRADRAADFRETSAEEDGRDGPVLQAPAQDAVEAAVARLVDAILTDSRSGKRGSASDRAFRRSS